MKMRKESFFGLHFDFHASPASCPAPIGGTLREEDIREICREVKPDFIQIDCKGHPGWASYPTELGNAMPNIKGDPLSMWRRVTAEEGVALYLHYSGVVDEKYCMEHPDQTVLNANGERRPWATRVNGTYKDERLIPQLKELAGKYGADGVWVDGECWGTEADFDPETVKQFEREKGIDLSGRLPVNRTDPYFDEYRDFCRELFKRYLRDYVDAVHAEYPSFQIASNWAFTDHMPEAVSANVDFLSGDLDPLMSFESARYAGRAIARQGRVWDLMSWNFRSHDSLLPGSVTKHPAQITQEAAAVISLGGGWQNYITQTRDGSPRMNEIRDMKGVGEFLREREKFCFRGRAVPQAALFFSTRDRLLESSSLYSRTGKEKSMGLTSLLCDAGHSLAFVSEFALESVKSYPVVVVPELYRELETETVNALVDYAKNGGSLLVCGVTACRFFADKGLPVRIGEETDQSLFTLDGKRFGRLTNAVSVFSEGAKAFARMEEGALSCVFPYGRGKIGMIGTDIGSAYLACAQYLHRELMNAVMNELYEPLVRIEECDGTLEISDLTVDGRLCVQLVNANGNHRNPTVPTESHIPSCRDIVLSVCSDAVKGEVFLQPGNRKLCGSVRDGRTYFSIDKVVVHEILEFTNGR